jgi:ligand-binding sensor domain-containing protein
MGDTVSDIRKNIDYILQDRKGNYWFASNGEGAYHYDGKTLMHITDKEGLASNFVWSIEEDINGHVWFSTRDKICSYNGTNFTDYTDTIKNAPFGKMDYKKGGLFFAHFDGICFYDGKSFTNIRIYPENYSPATNDINRPYSVYSTLADRKGHIWFGTQSEGVCHYDGKKFSYLTEKNLAGFAVRTIFEDKKGNLWFGNNGGGLFCYDGKTLTNVSEEKGLASPIFSKNQITDRMGSLARVWSINEDEKGNLWVGTIDAGLWKFEGTNLINYTTNDGLAGNAIWKIYKDRAGEFWIITNGDAICKFNGKSFSKYAFH